MNDSTLTATDLHYAPRAFLAAVGAAEADFPSAFIIKVQQCHLFAPVAQQVSIHQKTIKHTPADKLYDAFLHLLAGARGLVEINKRVRSDPVLSRAFGRTACAEQSVMQQTLDACTQENVEQMRQAFNSKK